jgi:hypothetical protein
MTFPINAATTRTRAAVPAAFVAVRDRSGEGSPSVIERKAGTAPNRVRMANSETAKLEYSGHSYMGISIGR